MRLLVLSKRQYTGKDLLDDAYGRLYELPKELARAGHEVRGLCASYRRRREGEFAIEDGGARVVWRSLNALGAGPLSLWRWLNEARRLVLEFRPEVIWACSDTFHAMLGVHLQRRYGVPCALDLYDNVEGFGAHRIPGLTACLRASVREAAALTCVSLALERLVRETYGARAPVLVLENGIGPAFFPRDRLECRRSLGLPSGARVIGTAGALGRERGIELLFEAFLDLAARDPQLHLLLAGRIGAGTRIPAHERVVYLGELAHERVPEVIGAMDLFVVCNERSSFGDYCFPQKLYEAVACRIPVLVADTGGVHPLLESAPGHAYEPGSLPSLVAGIEKLLAQPALAPFAAKSWTEHAQALSAFLGRVAQRA